MGHSVYNIVLEQILDLLVQVQVLNGALPLLNLDLEDLDESGNLVQVLTQHEAEVADIMSELLASNDPLDVAKVLLRYGSPLREWKTSKIFVLKLLELSEERVVDSLSRVEPVQRVLLQKLQKQVLQVYRQIAFRNQVIVQLSFLYLAVEGL